jgi:hypothetical protein
MCPFSVMIFPYPTKGWTTEESELGSHQGQEIRVLFTASELELGSTQPPTLKSSWVKAAGV